MDYQDFIEPLAREAGAIIRGNFQLGMAKEWKEDLTPVTATDTAVNRLVIERVQVAYRGHGILGEEEDAAVENAEYVWVCDPVDGTRPFAQGLPLSTFSLALTKNGEPIAGAVYDPFLDRFFYAEKGKGAFLNGKSIQVNDADTLRQQLVAVELYQGDGWDLLPLAGSVRHAGGVPTCFCAIIYPTVLIAAGQVAGSVFPSRKPHDGAAIKVIVEEAGGMVTDLFGNEQRYDRPIQGFLASNGKTHAELVRMTQEALAAAGSAT